MDGPSDLVEPASSNATAHISHILNNHIHITYTQQQHTYHIYSTTTYISHRLKKTPGSAAVVSEPLKFDLFPQDNNYLVKITYCTFDLLLTTIVYTHNPSPSPSTSPVPTCLCLSGPRSRLCVCEHTRGASSYVSTRRRDVRADRPSGLPVDSVSD